MYSIDFPRNLPYKIFVRIDLNDLTLDHAKETK